MYYSLRNSLNNLSRARLTSKVFSIPSKTCRFQRVRGGYSYTKRENCNTPSSKERQFTCQKETVFRSFSLSRLNYLLQESTIPNQLISRNDSTISSSITYTRPIVGYWLLGTAALVFGIVILGGLTRLTESGLSIVEWKPITGVLLPITEQQWEEEFERYKQFPEYKKLNTEMSLHDFKFIYLMEWAHRMWGRAIGVSFILPAVYFGARGYMTRSASYKVIGLAGLLGFQGFLGWYMVKSGLSEELMDNPGAVPRVSHYRLVAHLGSAFLLYIGMLLTGLQILRDAKIAKGTFPVSISKALLNPAINVFRRSAIGTATLIFLTSLSGALVAGLDAGLIYNEFPYMGKNIVPPHNELFSKVYTRPGDVFAWRNFFDNPTTVQFDHRVMAMTTLGVVIALWIYSRRVPITMNARRASNILLGVAGMQATLGISTLIYMVPIPLASAHQAGSLTLLTSALWLVHLMRRIPPLIVKSSVLKKL
ncbi:7055_t:CDS:2 [Ambispora gerdemannii]|uniref:7055_t:CDS:1 n=1 Tax=Ambispora gerdemannii TaxID=144530 RepID=A0A9N8Z5M4_9GLOM|nr:7055_t:CDS:2 [Ambispora gerdemannii]